MVRIDPAHVAQVRSFDRTVTEAIGALQDRFLGRDRPLGEARVLWEVGETGIAVRDLRRRLGLDAGYLSRVLGALSRAGLVELAADPADARVRVARLTEAGRRERAELDRLSDGFAAGVLEPLTAEERDQLAAAMRSVERLLLRSRTRIAVVPATHPDVRWAFGRYYAELDRRFDGGFETALTRQTDPADLSLPRGLVTLAYLGEEPVGCGALRLHPDGVAEIKRVWVAPRLRGVGLGGRLLARLETLAADHGAQVLRLDTNRALAEAIGMYRRAGYQEVPPFNDERYADHWFEKRLPRGRAVRGG